MIKNEILQEAFGNMQAAVSSVSDLVQEKVNAEIKKGNHNREQIVAMHNIVGGLEFFLRQQIEKLEQLDKLI